MQFVIFKSYQGKIDFLKENSWKLFLVLYQEVLFLSRCSELHLSATWPSLSEEMIVDNDVYS